MRDALLLSYFCPKFSVFNAEAYEIAFGFGSSITPENLKAMNFHHAAAWIEERAEKFDSLKADGKRWREKEQKGQFEIIQWGESAYPKNLESLTWPPAFLFRRGQRVWQNAPLVSIVGARNPTDIGRLWVRKIVPELVQKNICLVSGGARGIDAETHWAALESQGKTVAFLPGSVVKPYPSHNDDIFARLTERGALLSEFPPGTPIKKENFHRRNRLIAGFADVVIIVEAGLRSGTLMTAHKAIDENRDVMVVPGPPLIASYEGSLELFEQGALLAKDEKDIILYLERKNVLK